MVSEEWKKAEECCRRVRVPESCMGMCMPLMPRSKSYSDPQSVCDAFEDKVRNCKKDLNGTFTRNTFCFLNSFFLQNIIMKLGSHELSMSVIFQEALKPLLRH